MEFDGVVQDLLEEGRMRVTVSDSFNDRELESAVEVLRNFEKSYRLDVPRTPPAFSMSAALWAAVVYYRACQYLTFREFRAEAAKPILEPFSGRRDAGAHYSADLTLRLLPDLLHRARTTLREDPLVDELTTLANSWPLSSVGLHDLKVDNLEPILEDECLSRMYVDRIIDRKDSSRLSHPQVRELLMEAVGIHVELAPHLVSVVKELNAQDESE